MQPSEWISLAALAVAALSVLVGPIISARVSRRARTDEDRRRVYLEAFRLMRKSRLDDQAARSVVESGSDFIDDEIEAMLGELMFVGSADVQPKVERFFRVYAAGMIHLGVWTSRVPMDAYERSEMFRDVEAELNLTSLLDETLKAMRADLAVTGEVTHRVTFRDVEEEHRRRWGGEFPK